MKWNWSVCGSATRTVGDEEPELTMSENNIEPTPRGEQVDDEGVFPELTNTRSDKKPSINSG